MSQRIASNEFLRGVNFGGWLVLEKWMTPSLFKGTVAEDEYTFMQTTNAKGKIDEHRRSFITEEDFRWLRDNGVNAVRIPVGYWIFDGDSPYTPCIEYLDWAVEMARKYDLKVLIDLHGAKGSQNGHDHSGKRGNKDWYRRREYRQQTIETLERLAGRYYDKPTVWGIELLNEPSFGLFQFKLRQFYKDAYRRLQLVARPGTRIVFHDAFTPRLLSGVIAGNADHPVVMDVHWYQFLDNLRRWRSLESYFRRLDRRKKLIDTLQKHQPVIVGEWSVVLSGEILDGRDEYDEREAFERHAALQLEVYGRTAGWFYWTYKTEGRGIWHFRSQVEDGVLVLH